MEDLPRNFDVIVVGTGLAESIVSAAVSRVGHTVLHLDPRDYYGGKWTTVNWDSLESGVFGKDPDYFNDNSLLSSELEWSNSIRNVQSTWYIEADDEKEKIRGLSRRFNIDVYPKVLLAREEVIQLLIDSNVSRYLEFKCIQKLFASLPTENDKIEPVPLSRSDIFMSKSLGLVEKRKLTKFIELVMKSENLPDNLPAADPEFKSLAQLVEQSKVNEKIQHLIKQAVKTVEDEFEMEKFQEDFVERCKVFLRSIGRYGNQTPYLWTLYGVGEICQAFCRLSAIYGGIFILKRAISSLKIDDDNQEGEISVISDGLELKTKHLVLSPELQLGNSDRNLKTVLRGILLVKGGSLHGIVQEEAKSESQMAVYKIGEFELIELDHSSLAVPKPYRLLHITGPFHDTDSPKTLIEQRFNSFLDFSGQLSPSQDEQHAPAENDASQNDTPAVDGVGKESLRKPVVIFGSYFRINFNSPAKSHTKMPSQEDGRIFDCSSFSTEITAEIVRAREMFHSMYPDEEFLPKAADGSEEAEAHGNDILDDFRPEGEERAIGRDTNEPENASDAATG